MNLIALASLSVLVVTASTQVLPRQLQLNVADARMFFDDFVKEHNRQYKDDADKEIHFSAFAGNLNNSLRLAQMSPTGTFKMNNFADYTKEEFLSLRRFQFNQMEKN